MADNCIAIACVERGYIRMYSILPQGLDEITPKDILYEDSPIKSLTAIDLLGLFVSLNSANDITVCHLQSIAIDWYSRVILDSYGQKIM
jgi:hypothetical protein